MSEEIERPRIVKALDVAGWLMILGGGACLLGGMGQYSPSSMWVTGLAGVLSGILFLAICAVMDKLSQIEHHLRVQAGKMG